MTKQLKGVTLRAVPTRGLLQVERMLQRVLAGNGLVLLCGTCLDARGLAEGELIADHFYRSYRATYGRVLPSRTLLGEVTGRHNMYRPGFGA
jgi:hypothetical protein